MNEKIFKNYGVDLKKEMEDRKPEDWVVGGVSDNLKGISEDVNLIDYLPAGEVQRGREDMMDCATRAPINILESKLNAHLTKMSSDNREWLEANGYTNNGQIEISDAFTAIKSGTSLNGNSLKAPLDSLRKDGFIPKKLLPLDPAMTWGQYHNPKRITSAIVALGKEAKARFPINYIRFEKEDFKNIREYDPIDVAGFAWLRPINGIYPKADRVTFPINHCFMDIPKTPQYTIFDNYIDPVDGDFIKRLAPDYDLYDFGYRIIVSEVTFSFELTSEMVRFAYLLEKDVRKEFPASNEFFSIYDPTRKYSIYDWCRKYGWKEHKEIFLENKLDWSLINATPQEVSESQEIRLPSEVELGWWQKLINWLKKI